MEEQLISRLVGNAGVTAIAGNRISWGSRPQAQDTPDVLLTKVSGGDNYDLQGITAIRQSRVQIDCYAEQFQDVTLLGRAVRECLSGQGFGDVQLCMLDMERSTFEDGTPPLHRTMLDFIVHHFA
jgi:hypothetical protein